MAIDWLRPYWRQEAAAWRLPIWRDAYRQPTEIDRDELLQRQIENLRTRLMAAGAEPPPLPEPLFVRALETLRVPERWMGQKLGEITGLGGEDVAEAVERLLVALGVPSEPLFRATIPWFGGGIEVAPTLPSMLGKAAMIFNPLDPINWLTFGLGKVAVKGAGAAAKAAARPLTMGLRVPWTGRVVAQFEPGALLGPLREPLSEVITAPARAIAETAPARALQRMFGLGMAPSMLPSRLFTDAEVSQRLTSLTAARKMVENLPEIPLRRRLLDFLDEAEGYVREMVGEAPETAADVAKFVRAETVLAGHHMEALAEEIGGKPFLKALGGLTKHEKDLVKAYLLGKPVDMPDKILEIADAVASHIRALENMTERAEIPVEFIEHFLPRVFLPGRMYPREILAEAGRLMKKRVGTFRPEDIPEDILLKAWAKIKPEVAEAIQKIDPSTKARTMFLDLKDPADINAVLVMSKYAPIFEEDIAISLSIWGTRRVKAIYFKEFADAAMSKYGLSLDEASRLFKEAPEEVDKWGLFRVKPVGESFEITRVTDAAAVSELAKEAPEALKGMKLLPDEIGHFLSGYGKAVLNPAEAKNAIKQMYDSWLRYFKFGTTAVIPGYWLRNKTGDFFNMFLAKISSPGRRAFEAYQVIRHPEKFRLKLPSGVVMTGEDVRFWSDLFGLTKSGFFTAEIVDTVPAKVLTAKPFKWLEQQGRVLVDYHSRLMLFIDRLHKGDDVLSAAVYTKKYLFDYLDLTPFERDVMRRIVPFYCVPEDSEILTRDGWKTVDDLEIHEEVLTYNVEGDYLEWQPCEDKHVFDHDQPLMVLTNSRIHLRFTSEHRWVVRVNPRAVKYKKSRDKIKVVAGKDLKTWHRIVMAAPLKNSRESLLTPEQARLLGWLMCDGYWRFRGNCCEALIYQHPAKFLDEVVTVAGGKPRKLHPDNGTVAVPVTQERIRPLIPYLDKDGLIRVVTRLSKEALEALCDAMYKAGGTVKQHRGSRDTPFFAAAHPGVRDAFRVAMLLLGKCTSGANESGTYVSERRTAKVSEVALLREHYKGRVWCPQTPNGTWVMRQNDTITITGNSWTRKNIPLQIAEFVKEPGKFTTVHKWLEALGEPTPREEVPEWLRYTMGVPLPGAQYLLPRLPYEDIARLQPREFLGALTPFIRAPFELGMGRHLYTGVPIRQPGEHPWAATMRYLYRHLMPGIAVRGPETLIGGITAALGGLGVAVPEIPPHIEEWLPWRLEERAARAIATTFLPAGFYPRTLAERSALYEEMERLMDLAARLKRLGIEVPTLRDLGLL